jgi:hypothetical protein
VIHGPRKTAELLASAKKLRDEEKLIWREIAKRLGVELPWLMKHKRKIEGVESGPIGVVQKKDLAATLDKVKTLLDQGARWKAIGKTLGLDWLKLYRLNRHHTNGTGKNERQRSL